MLVVPMGLLDKVAGLRAKKETVTADTQAIAEFLQKGGHRVHYLRRPFRREPDFGATGVLYDFSDLLGRAGEPS